MNLVYQKQNYNVYKVSNGYIIQNMNMKNFSHTHIKHLGTCKYLIELSLSKRCFGGIPRYLLISLLRVNDDEKYCSRIENLLSKEKKQSYYRPTKRK